MNQSIDQMIKDAETLLNQSIIVTRGPRSEQSELWCLDTRSQRYWLKYYHTPSSALRERDWLEKISSRDIGTQIFATLNQQSMLFHDVSGQSLIHLAELAQGELDPKEVIPKEVTPEEVIREEVIREEVVADALYQALDTLHSYPSDQNDPLPLHKAIPQRWKGSIKVVLHELMALKDPLRARVIEGINYLQAVIHESTVYFDPLLSLNLLQERVLCHRDLRLSHIFFDRQTRTVRFIDFGQARYDCSVFDWAQLWSQIVINPIDQVTHWQSRVIQGAITRRLDACTTTDSALIEHWFAICTIAQGIGGFAWSIRHKVPKDHPAWTRAIQQLNRGLEYVLSLP